MVAVALAPGGVLAAACGSPSSDGDTGRGQSTSPPIGSTPSGDWPVYGGEPGQRRFSPLSQLDTVSVARLEPAWTHRTGVTGIFESTPVVAGGALYVTTPVSRGEQRVLRLDAATGRREWEARIALRRPQTYPAPVNRGAAVEGDRVYVGTADARLVALDAATGDVVWETRTAPEGSGFGHKQAPLVHDGRIFLGASGSPFGIRGFVKAFRARDGAHLWTWHSIPSPDEGGWWGAWRDAVPAPAGGEPIPLGRDIRREKRDSARYADAWRRGGGAVWMTPSLDEERGLLFVGVGNPAPELNGWLRPGDNRWTVAVCAVRARDGTTEWCSQYLPHDVWGLDAASPPFLFHMRSTTADGVRAGEPGAVGRAPGGRGPGGSGRPAGGDPVPAVGHFSKLGFLFVWDRRDGTLLTRSEPYVPQENFLAPPTAAGTRMAPGIYGGTEWSPGSYSPETRLAYAANVHLPGSYVIRGGVPAADDPPSSVGFDEDFSDARGNVVAVDPATGRVAWSVQTPRPMVGGVLATAGGIVFAGLLDGGLAAWHADTGSELWRGETGTGCASAPVTYRAAGRQMVAVACGGHFLGGPERGDYLHAFALPERPGPGESGPP